MPAQQPPTDFQQKRDGVLPDTRREARRKSQWPESGSEMGLITQWTEIPQQPPTGLDRRWDRGTVGLSGDGTVGLIAQWPEIAQQTTNSGFSRFRFDRRSQVWDWGIGVGSREMQGRVGLGRSGRRIERETEVDEEFCNREIKADQVFFFFLS